MHLGVCILEAHAFEVHRYAFVGGEFRKSNVKVHDTPIQSNQMGQKQHVL